MSSGVRRIVTWKDISGNSYAGSDTMLMPSKGVIELWQSTSLGSNDVVPFYPPPAASLFRIFELPPAVRTDDPANSEKAAAEVFTSLNAEHCRINTTRDPWMHETPTTDYVFILSGIVDLTLDIGAPLRLHAGSVIIQRGTNHAWHNAGTEPARLLVVMVGTTEASIA